MNYAIIGFGKIGQALATASRSSPIPVKCRRAPAGSRLQRQSCSRLRSIHAVFSWTSIR